MRKLLVVVLYMALLAGSTFLPFGIVRFCAARFATPKPYMWELTYVSESPNAYCYHYSEDCKALRRTTYDIDVLLVDEAEELGYEPCSMCLRESVRKEWDGFACLLMLLVGLLIFWMICKVDRFHREYKFRSPIEKR